MSVRKMLMVCVVAMAAILPLVGCNGKDSGGTGEGAGSDTSNTTSSTE